VFRLMPSRAATAVLLPGQAPVETRGLLARQWTAFTRARLQDDAEADPAGHCRTPLPRRHA
jgi:hypothetical protein